MARIRGIEGSGARWFIKLAYWLMKRKLGRVPEPMKITAHHGRLFRAMVEMERGQMAARSLDLRLKELAGVKAAMMVGCPF